MQMHQHDAKSELIFYGGMYEETLEAMLDAQEYFAQFSERDQANISPVERLVYCAEISRITLRLSSVMAWLMARRAVSTGELNRRDAVEQFRLAFPDICLQDLPEMHAVLPEYVCNLLDKSLAIYQRAARLDRMLAENAAPKTLH